MPMNTSAAVGARLFRGFADSTRLAVLLRLAEGERRVTDLVAEVGSSQPNVSGHLACLEECGLVAARPDGRQTFYRIASPEVLDLLAAAERTLTAHGHRVRLCPRLGRPARTPARPSRRHASRVKVR
jgi:ArsR family transcriptional regulator, cadmium/lead-responsive transcriptional repressor